jgi:antitoxin FitA
MAKMIQVRNVTDRMHRELKRRARARGQSLTTYIEEILERELARPDPEAVFERIRSLPPIAADLASADLIRAERREAGRE